MIKRSDIFYVQYTIDNQHEFIDEINKFNCNNNGLNQALKQSHNRDVTTLLFINNINNSVIGFCSYCCSSIKIDEVLYPAVEIKSFAISEDYQDKYFFAKYNNDTDLCAAYIFRFCIEKIERICKDIMCARFIILYSYQNEKIRKFYLKNLFAEFSANHYTLRDTGEYNNIYSLIHYISK